LATAGGHRAAVASNVLPGLLERAAPTALSGLQGGGA
jgi:hypothetical protein